jgi:hypothetical protein
MDATFTAPYLLVSDPQALAVLHSDRDDNDRRTLDRVEGAEAVWRVEAELPMRAEGCGQGEELAVARLPRWLMSQRRPERPQDECMVSLRQCTNMLDGVTGDLDPVRALRHPSLSYGPTSGHGLGGREAPEEWRRCVRLEVVAGRIVACDGDDRGLDVAIRLRGGGMRTERLDAIVRCIGPALERAETDNPLMSSLFASGLEQPDPTGLGLVTDEQGRIVRPDGGRSERLLAIGALRHPAEWESTAVPDIARQAAELARHILG